ncbi:DUF6350 family protein [Rothia sp. P6271]|uniref:cell division protein PerM n=1 Tax=Rothia sp. P6271 TaxID=3402659 RepID=UPI003AC5B940
MKTSVMKPQQRSIPMPLWLQGVVELFRTAFYSCFAVVLLLGAVWFTGGFEQRDLYAMAVLVSQMWLLIHGVPLHLNISAPYGDTPDIQGTMSFIPLGLTLIPLWLCFRSGRVLAQASREGQFWIPTLTGAITYSACAGGLSLLTTDTAAVAYPVASALVPCWVVLSGLILGGWYESRSLARMIGVNAAEWVAQFSQYSRWAGSYVWTVLRASIVAVLAFIGCGGLLLSLSLLWHWSDVVTIYQLLDAGAIGDTALTFLQLGVIPNVVFWAMSWSVGAGFSLGEHTSVNFFEHSTGVLPAFPLLGALPTVNEPWNYIAIAVPVLCGIVAGWWFFRAGEDHLDEWLSLKIPFRWISLPLSTFALAIFVSVPAGIILALCGWASRGSLGMGRFTDLGPDALLFGALSAGWIACGVMMGSVMAPIFHRGAITELERFSELKNDREERRRRKRLAREQKKAQRRNSRQNSAIAEVEEQHDETNKPSSEAVRRLLEDADEPLSDTTRSEVTQKEEKKTADFESVVAQNLRLFSDLEEEHLEAQAEASSTEDDVSKQKNDTATDKVTGDKDSSEGKTLTHFKHGRVIRRPKTRRRSSSKSDDS